MTKPLLIVVDDEPEMAEFISDVAKSMGFEVMKAATANACQELLRTNVPAGVVMDIVMPDMDGNELLLWMSKENHTVPIIIVSGHNGKYLDMTCELAKRRGCNIIGKFSKPIRVNEIGTALSQLID